MMNEADDLERDINWLHYRRHYKLIYAVNEEQYTQTVLSAIKDFSCFSNNRVFPTIKR